jgi:2-amino-4-hydroxy-6-hydroxymethyldihydropteridine diphosphokinase
MNTIYLLLGGNKGDKLQTLQQTIAKLEQEVGCVIKQSGIYVTAAWGNTNQPDFFNQAICIETQLSPFDLLVKILAIEESLGRVRTDKKWAERTIDIDILFYNDEIIDTPDLKIPHPFIQERKFVLIPMLDIAAKFMHPQLNKSIQTLLNECEDTLKVSENPLL